MATEQALASTTAPTSLELVTALVAGHPPPLPKVATPPLPGKAREQVQATAATE